jgi:hypothetical protein
MKIKNKFYLSSLLVLLILFIIAFFFIDIGINSKFFIKNAFNNSFEYRVSGDCVAFSNSLNRDKDKWKTICEKEKSYSDATPIRKFRIQNISYKFGSDRAFLQVELTRLVSEKDYSYSANYEMKKVGFFWKIDQEQK